MATLALAAAGAAVGSALLPSGVAILGATLTGAAIGSQVGALAGSYVDQALFGGSGGARHVDGPRLSDLHVTASTEGAAIPRVYGQVRIGGQIIWATDFEEEAVTSSASGGAKGGTGSGATSTAYRHYANFAVALCEGEIAGLGRVWANGTELDLATVTCRLHKGSETQAPDTLIEARLGAGDAPAFRGTAYVVFERLALAPFGNRLPQLSFEVYRPVDPFAASVRGVVVIPGSGEFVYEPSAVTLTTGYAASTPENSHTRQGGTDWTVAMDQLQAGLPNVRAASLVVAWFGTDLRADHCELHPGVERRDKATTPLVWSVAGMDCSTAYLVSQRAGRPAYGGTPSDNSVVAAIADLKARGIAVTLNPFILMDVAEVNALASPYGGATQPAYPWRGRITVSPSPGQPGSPDKSAAAAAAVTAFVGTAAPAHFALSGGTVVYSGPAEWSYRRMILHYAMLAKAAGGVDAFLIGSELRGLTTVRSGPATYPFVAALIALAADVKAILGPATKVTYAADWSEYFGHHPADGTGDVYFHLDPLWSSAAIDAVAIDVYWPLADWRDGPSHRDALDGVPHIYDLAYLKRNVTGGEGYDWFYASDADRDGQVRTPITDGTAAKPWVFRYKDIRSWWLSRHYDRPGGVEASAPTAWLPQSKPFWFMEAGCGAVDKAANEPNAFPDPKSSENRLPHYSRGTRDDLVQRRYLRALIEAFDPAADGYVAGANPISTVYGAPMVDLARIHAYAWDARPYPAFPAATGLWSDGANWPLGHWLNGRAAAAPLADTVDTILADAGVSRAATGGLSGIVAGYAIDRVMSAREALRTFELAYFVDAVESGGALHFRQRGAGRPVAAIPASVLVETKPGTTLLDITRGQETELPAVAKVRYISASGDYRQAVAESRRLAGASARVSEASIPVVMDAAAAATTADTWLFESWASRERFAFALPPSCLALEPGDVVTLETAAGARTVRITSVSEAGIRQVEATSYDAGIYAPVPAAARPASVPGPSAAGQPVVHFLDLPLLRGDEAPTAGYVAALANPWPGGIAIYSSPESTGFRLRAIASRPATVGTLATALPPGPASRWSPEAATVDVALASGTLASASALQVLAGANVAAIQGASGAWEVIQFRTATLLAPRTYRLGGLLRGQAGTEALATTAIPSGSPIVLLDEALTALAVTPDEVGLPLTWRSGPSARGIGDASYRSDVHAFGAAGTRPYAPVHVRATRSAAGDLAVTFVRRTRSGGDTWEAAEVPLSEEAERYEVDILSTPSLSGATAVRTLSLTAPAFTYTAASQIADFGALQGAIGVRIAQVSAIAGRGWPAIAAL